MRVCGKHNEVRTAIFTKLHNLIRGKRCKHIGRRQSHGLVSSCVCVCCCCCSAMLENSITAPNDVDMVSDLMWISWVQTAECRATSWHTLQPTAYSLQSNVRIYGTNELFNATPPCISSSSLFLTCCSACALNRTSLAILPNVSLHCVCVCVRVLQNYLEFLFIRL